MYCFYIIFKIVFTGNIPAKDLNNSHILLGDSRQTSQSNTLALFMLSYAWSFSCTGEWYSWLC